MEIKPTAIEFCCTNMKDAVLKGYIMITPAILASQKNQVQIYGIEIKFCPFCGYKIFWRTSDSI